MLVDLLSWALLLTGSAAVVIGCAGLVRLPDFYSRIHAAGMTDTFGAWLILGGLMLQNGWNLVLAKLAFVLFFLLLTSPLASHALAKAAYLRGLKPLLGPWRREGD